MDLCPNRDLLFVTKGHIHFVGHKFMSLLETQNPGGC